MHVTDGGQCGKMFYTQKNFELGQNGKNANTVVFAPTDKLRTVVLSSLYISTPKSRTQREEQSLRFLL